MTPSVNRASEVWQEIKPYAMQDLKAMQSGAKIIASSSGYQIVLYAQKTRYYDGDSSGLDAAIAAAETGDTISLPTITIGGDHTVPAGVSLIGIDRNRSILTGQITLSENAHLNKVSVVRSASSGTLTGVILSGDNARVYNCVVDITNNGGDATGVYCNSGVSGYVDDCVVSATASGNGYGCYVNTAYLYIQAGRISGSTSETYGTSVIYHLSGMESAFLDTGSIAWSYHAASETFEAIVLPGGVDHDQLLNFVANEHVNHGGISIIAGNGLTGGGDILANRTLAVGAGNGISVAADAVAVDLTYSFVWTNKHTFQDDLTAYDIYARNLQTRHIFPEDTDTYDLGSSVKLWRKGYLSEMDALLFAQNTISLLGGWLMVTKGEGTFVGNVADSDTSIDFGQAMTVGDFVLCRAAGKVEYFEIGSVVTGTTYNVTRNLDGSGANDWAAGTPYAVLGSSGDGRVELNAYDSPRIQLVQQGATYNAQNELMRIGDLNGGWGYGSSIYGMAIGKYGTGLPNLTMDATNGLRIRSGADDIMQFDVSGNALITNKIKLPGVNSALTIGSTPPTAADAGTGIWIDRTGLYGLLSDVYQVKIDAATGYLVAGQGDVILDANGISIYIEEISYSPNKIKFLKKTEDTEIFEITAYYVPPEPDPSGLAQGNIHLDAEDISNILNIGTVTRGDSYLQSSAILYATQTKIGYPMKYSRIAIEVDGYGAENIFLQSNNIRLSRYLADSGEAACIVTIVGTLRLGADALQKYYGGSYRTGYLFVPLTTPLTSTSWDGDARSTTAKTLIDLSAVFGVPAGVKAVSARLEARDSGSSGIVSYFGISPNNVASNLAGRVWLEGVPNDSRRAETFVCPCDVNGDIYYQINATGTGTLDAWLEIWGYWI
jgi:hypothetical protein